ncbi:MAG: hypothetical protein R6X34_27895, partial [Chloroflexota bacterium]
QGRVFTLIGSLSGLMSPVGLIIAGPVADAFGVQAWFVVGGMATMLMGIVGFFIPMVMNVEAEREADLALELPALSRTETAVVP